MDVDDVVEVIVELTDVELVDEMDVVDVNVLPTNKSPQGGTDLKLKP